jgi:hypothetical protein
MGNLRNLVGLSFKAIKAMLLRNKKEEGKPVTSLWRFSGGGDEKIRRRFPGR